MPKVRTPLDVDRYQKLARQGLSQRQIARELGIAESTLRENLKARQTPQTSQGVPHVDEGTPQGGPEVDQGTPQGGPEVDVGVRHGGPEGDQGPPPEPLSAQDLQDLQNLLAWWRARHQLLEEADAPERQLERQTYHIEKRFIDAVRREADLTRESYAAVVNRAFAQYFAGRST